jgi:hypothetical protein
MAQIVKLRRSSVSGQKPTNSNLQLGELALNTTDGKVFFAKSGSLGPTVEELVSTNTVNTGSIYLTGDITGSIFTGSFKGDGSGLYNIPASGITGGISTNKIFSGSVSASISPDRGLEINTKTIITGSITLAKTEDPDPSGLTTQATHLFVSASNNQTGEDLYIRQQDNKVKWKWIEGKLNTGILWGGSLSYSGSTIYITKGSGIIIDQRASATSEISPITHYVNWNDITASCQNLTSSLVTYVGVDMSGSLYQQDNYFSVTQYRTTIPLGMFNHTNKSTITSVANDVITAYDDVNQTSNFIQAFGPLKLEGLTLQAQSGNLQLTIGAGQSFIYGGFYQQDPNNASHKITSPVVTPQIARIRRDGSGSFIVDNNNGNFYTTIETGHWDDGTGTLNTLGGNYSIQRVYFNPFTNRVHVYYGQYSYGNKTLALQGLSTDPFVEAEYSAHQYVFVGYLVIKGGTSDLSDTNINTIVQSGLFRNTVGSSGSSQVLATLHDLSDVDIATEANGDLLSYNSTTGKWTHGKSLTGNYQITGSLNITGGLTGSIDYSNITNKPTLVSGSSQIYITGTTGYSTFSGSISSSIGSLSSSIATTTNDLDGRLDSIEGVTGSYATTGSNTFIGNEIVSGNIVLANNGQIQVHSSTTNTLFGHFDGSTIYGPYYQMFGNNYSNVSQRGSSEFVFDTRNGGESGFNVASFDGSTWIRKFRVDDSGAKITGSLIVTNNVTSSYFTGSFIGDGSQLYNIPASGVTGLNLSQITDGSATASISDADGFRVNRDSEITGSLFVSGALNVGIKPTYNDPSNSELLHVENSGSYNIANFIGNSDSYAQINVTNRNTGPNVSSDVVATADNGTEENFFIDMGINSSTYTAGVVGEANDAYLINAGSDLFVGTLSTGSLNLFTNFNWQNPQISISSSGQIGFNTEFISTGYTYELSGSALFDHNVRVKGDLTVDGTITANELHITYTSSSVQYTSGSTKFGDSIDDTHQFTGSVDITGSLYLNGSPVGTGKLDSIEFYNYTSSVNPKLNALEIESGSIRSDFNSYTSSTNNRLISIETSTGSLNLFTTSYNTGSFTGSFIGDATGLVNAPFHITGSDVDGNQYDKTFTKLHFDSDTGLNVSESAVGTAFISIGSHFKDIFVSGSPILSATGSDAFEIIPEGGVNITTSITDTNSNGYVKELKISTLNLSSSINNSISSITGSINSLNDFTGSANSHFYEIDNFTSSVVLTNQTSSMTVLSSSYAVTAAFALNVVGGGGGGGSISDGAYAELNQTTPSTSWTFVHNLGQKYPIFQVFDTSDRVIIPTQITATDNNTATITFSSAQAGRVIASLGTGPGGMTQYFDSDTTWSLSHNMGTDYPIVTVYGSNRKIIYPQDVKSIDGNNIEVYFSTPVAGYLNVAKGGHIISGSLDLTQINLGGSGLISGSAQIANFGYATTGSNTFTANQVINGTLTLNKAKMGSTCVTLSTGVNQLIFDLSGFDGANFDYVVKNGSNMRGGLIMSVWDNYDARFNESSTTDLGNTSDVTFTVSADGKLKATVASGTWQIEVMYRALKCS